jgi:GntR family transcriptional regulator, transcriptional repressor for pyruvate dehydrogenase complex
MSPIYQPIGRRRLADEIVDQIEALIVRSELRVGDPLPPERELARRLQVSRNALREAIGMLEQKGMVEVRAGSGTYVSQPSAAFIGDSLHLLLRFNENTLLDLMEARSVVESETAALAAQTATADTLRAVKAALDQMDAHVNEPDQYTEADLTFHTELAQAAGNQVLQLFVLSLRSALRENIRYFSRTPNENEKSLRFHHRIYEAVLARQPDEARQNMCEHFQPFIQHVRAGLASGTRQRG